MFSYALALAALGFIALIVAVILGSTAWAWVCVAIAAVGVILFIVDWIRHRKNPRART